MNGHLLWFRMWSEAVDDEKLRLLAFEDRWHFVAILCCKAQGLLGQNCETDETFQKRCRNADETSTATNMVFRKVAVKLGLQLRELDEVARRLAEVGLIDAETLQPVAWEKRQSPSDISTERVRTWREKQRNKRNASETLQKRFRNTPEAEAEAEAEEENPPTPQKPKSAKLKPVWTLPPEIDPVAWAEFEAHRREIQKPLTDRARSANAKILSAMSPADQRKSIEATIASRWTGLFPPKPNGANHADPHHRGSDIDANHRALADCEARARAHFPEMG